MSSYDATIVHELHNNNAVDMEKNIKFIVNWVNKWIQNAEESKNNIFVPSNWISKLFFTYFKSFHFYRSDSLFKYLL